MQQHENFLQKGVNMTCPSGKEWSVKCGWCAHFQDSRGYFTTGWTTNAVDNELKVDNKLLFTITSPFRIIVKVLGTIKIVLSANDKADILNEEVVIMNKGFLFTE
jgi:hypothetical protein